LSPNLTEAHVKEIFSNFGEIHSIGIRQNPKVKHYAVINFKAKEDAEQAQTHMNNGQIDGMIISVQIENPTKSEDGK
jgi:RNA-binding protein with serine-rich domain 1